MDKKGIPSENIEIYCHIFLIENALRELIIEELGKVFGPKWYNSRLPSDVLQKYRDGKKYERNIKWVMLIPQHPIYYVDFTDLKKVIDRSDNWKDVFSAIFLRKDVILATLTELEFIRNKIAHNRKASIKDLEIVKGAETKLSEFIGSNRYLELISQCSFTSNIYETLTELKREFEHSYEVCKCMGHLDLLKTWSFVNTCWWFDEYYLGSPIIGIKKYFEILLIYQSIPRVRGNGYKIEYWVKNSEILINFDVGISEFIDLLNIYEKSEI